MADNGGSMHDRAERVANNVILITASRVMAAVGIPVMIAAIYWLFGEVHAQRIALTELAGKLTAEQVRRESVEGRVVGLDARVRDLEHRVWSR